MMEEIEEDEVIGELEDAIISRKKIGEKPMTIEEAIIHLSTTKAAFYAFIDQETSRVNVLYGCGEGRYKLLES